jgi:DNA-binding response OmpR family regulator
MPGADGGNVIVAAKQQVVPPLVLVISGESAVSKTAPASSQPDAALDKLFHIRDLVNVVETLLLMRPTAGHHAA